MSRWSNPIPKRNWHKWGVAYVSHMTTGAIAQCGAVLGAALIDPFLLTAVAIHLLVIARQGLEFMRRNDTPGRDLMDHIIGAVIGWGAAAAILAVLS